MNLDFLKEENWPKLDGRSGPGTSQLHHWCAGISKVLLSLADRLDRLESQENQKNIDISKLKIDIETAKKQTANTSNISSNWVQVIKQGAKNAKKPAAQLAVANATISEMNEREKRKKNVIIHGVTESARENLTDKRADDDAKIKEIFKTVGKEDVEPIYFRRLRSKDTSRPGPILVELSDAAIRNPLLLAAKKLRESESHKSVFISPDLTEAERSLDYELRKQRKEANEKLEQNSPFRYGIRGNQLVKIKSRQ
jgi:hypothetical protein